MRGRWRGDDCCREKVASEPRAIAESLRAMGLGFERVGLEAGPLSFWLHDGLRAEGLPAR